MIDRMEESVDYFSLEGTPSWAVAAVCTILIILALLIEHAFHLLTLLFDKRRRKPLICALYNIKSELRKLGFMSLLLTMAKEPISKICIPRSMTQHFLPCKDSNNSQFKDELQSCPHNKVSLLSSESTEQVQTLIFLLAVFHVISCLITFLLGDVKMGRWKSWEEETHSMEFKLTNDPRRFEMACKTSFGKRHLNLWSDKPLFLWLVCYIRQFVNPISKADYYTLRHGFLTVHFNSAIKFDFHKFILRSLDRDFLVVVRISLWIWIYAMLFLFIKALEFYDRYWPSFIPLVILSVVGTKLQVIITTMCLKSNHDLVIVPGTVSVTPDDSLFWFNRPQFLLHIIQFIQVQNSFHLMFCFWSWYNFGLRSCFHTQIDDVVITIVIGLLVQFLCAYITLPLYALVTQMGTSMKASFFSDEIVQGLKRWHKTAKENLEEKKSSSRLSRSSTMASTSTTIEETSCTMSKCSLKDVKSYLSGRPGSLPDSITPKSRAPTASIWSRLQKIIHPSEKLQASTFLITTEKASGTIMSTPRVQEFNFPSGRQELLEVQKVVEEIIQNGGNSMAHTGDLSFRLWKNQGRESSPRRQELVINLDSVGDNRSTMGTK